MHRSPDRWMFLCSLTLSTCLLLTLAACSRSSQQPPPANAAPAAAPGQPAPNAAAPPASAPPAVAPGQPAGGGTAAPATAAGQPAAGPAATAAVQPAPPPPRKFTFAEGTVLVIETSTALSSETQSPGEKFEASLAEPIVEGDWVVAKQGAPVEGLVVNSTKGGRVKGTAQIEIAVTGLTLADGQRVAIETALATAAAKSEKNRDIGKVAIATGAGAIIGAIAGGGKGAAIGAGVGGVGGTAVVLGTRGKPAVIPARSKLRFKVTRPVEVTEKQ